MSDRITYELDGPVARITLTQPGKLNAFSLAMVDELRELVQQAANDTAVVGLVITGAGRGFCSGLDVADLSDAVSAGSSGQERARVDEMPGLFSWLLTCDKPVIAAVNGVAAGAGLVLALMADIRIASTVAAFTTVFSKRGLTAEHGISWILPRLVGPSRALDLLWTSRKIDAAEAYRIGLVDSLAEPENLLTAANAYVAELAENVSPASVRDTKRLVYAHMGIGYDAAFRDAEEVRLASLDRVDATEGAEAFIEKRPPSFPRLGRD
jgi:enoyl-CoA hydratase/carnithine racemase